MGKKKKHGRKGGMTLPMAVLVPVGIQAYIIGKMAMSGRAGQDQAIESITGYHPGVKGFNTDAFVGTWGPIAAGCVVHWGASKLGLNRLLGRAKIPIFRV